MQKKHRIEATIVEPTDKQEIEDISIENFSAKNNKLTAKVKKEGSEFLLMHSLYDPDKEADNIVSKLDFSKHGLFITFGIGLGYHLERILKNASSKSVILVIEQSKNVYDNFIKNVNPSFLLDDKRVIVFNSIDPKKIAVVLEFISRGNSIIGRLGHNIQYAELNYHKVIFQGVSADVIHEISEIAKMNWKMLGNCHVDHNIGAIQPILNIEDIIDNVGVEAMSNCYKGKAAIVVSAGPSLDKNMRYLAEAKGKIFIAAVDAVLPKLLKNNIIPDAVVTVERVSIYKNIFSEMTCDIPESIVLLAPALTEVKTLKLFKRNNKVFFFQSGVGTQLYYDKVIKKGSMTSGTSAAFTAISFCKEFGFNKIAFVGQDFAYAEDGRVYCDDISKAGNAIEQERKNKSGFTTYVKDYNGKDILSNILWKDQLTTFKLFIKSNPGIKAYDATEGGALIEGAEIITLLQYIKENEHERLEDINTIINEKKKNMKGLKVDIINELFKKLSTDYNSFLEIQDSIENQFNNLTESYNKYVVENKNFNTKQIDKNVQLIDVSQKIIDRITENGFINLYYQSMIAGFRKEVNQIAEKNFEKSLRLHIKVHYEFFNLLYPIFKLNLKHIKFILEVLEAKIKNEEINDDIVEIFKKIMTENDIDPEFIYSYFKVEKEERI